MAKSLGTLSKIGVLLTFALLVVDARGVSRHVGRPIPRSDCRPRGPQRFLVVRITGTRISQRYDGYNFVVLAAYHRGDHLNFEHRTLNCTEGDNVFGGLIE